MEEILKFRILFSPESDDIFITAMEEGKITFSLTTTGKADIKDSYGIQVSKDKISVYKTYDEASEAMIEFKKQHPQYRNVVRFNKKMMYKLLHPNAFIRNVFTKEFKNKYGKRSSRKNLKS